MRAGRHSKRFTMPGRRRTKTQRATNERLGWLIRPMVAMARDTRGFVREPEGTLAKHGRAFSRAFERRRAVVAEHELLADLHFAFVPPEERRRVLTDLPKHLAQRRLKLEADALGAELLTLVDQADRKVRNGPIVLAVYLFERNEATFAAYSSLLDAQRARSEERATRLFLAYVGKLLESQYQRYVRVVDTLDAWCRDEKPRADTFGQIVDRLARRRPSLVQPDAARVRNALEHGEFVPHLADHTLELKNTYRGEIKWTVTRSLDDISTLASNAARACDVLFQALGLVAQERHAQAGTFEYVFAMGDAYAANDLAEVVRISRDYRDAMQRVLTGSG